MKLAFCFLSHNDIAHPRAWKAFFRAAPREAYGIWLHRRDRHTASELPGVTCIPTHPTQYAKFSLVQAQQHLLEAACLDEEVTKCLLLSGDTVPLRSFDEVLTLMSHDKGVLAWSEGLNQLQRGREATVRRDAWPEAWGWVWRIAPQWCLLTREHVRLLSKHWDVLADVFGESVAPDEHMYSVFFHAVGCLDSFLPEHFMHVDWYQLTRPAACGIKHRAHPRTFHRADLNQRTIRELRERGAVMLRKVCERYDCPPLWMEPGPGDKDTLGDPQAMVLTPASFPLEGATKAGSGVVLRPGSVRGGSTVLHLPPHPDGGDRKPPLDRTK
jgi:Core-2/I-Branching enzyme